MHTYTKEILLGFETKSKTHSFSIHYVCAECIGSFVSVPSMSSPARPFAIIFLFIFILYPILSPLDAHDQSIEPTIAETFNRMLLAAASRSTNVWCGSVSSILLRSNARQLQSSCTWLHAKQFSSEESPFQKDKSLHYVTQKESEVSSSIYLSIYLSIHLYLPLSHRKLCNQFINSQCLSSFSFQYIC